jgi:hypothetical protein
MVMHVIRMRMRLIDVEKGDVVCYSQNANDRR